MGSAGRGRRPARLYRNKRRRDVRDVTVGTRTRQARAPMGANFGDLDSDGFPDFDLGTGNPICYGLLPIARCATRSRKVPGRDDGGNFGHLQKGHGTAFGDVDNDGDQDLVAVMGGVYQGDASERLLFLNPVNGHHWVTLRLRRYEVESQRRRSPHQVVVETRPGPRVDPRQV